MDSDVFWGIHERLNPKSPLDDFRMRLLKLTWKNLIGFELRQRTLLKDAFDKIDSPSTEQLTVLVETMLDGKKSWEEQNLNSLDTRRTMSFDMEAFFQLGNEVWFERHVINSRMIRDNPWKIGNAIFDFEKLSETKEK
jgi:hypothetical protein